MPDTFSKSVSEPDELLPLTSDLVFKQVLGQEESKPILMEFLNDILNLNIQSPDQLILQNPNIDREHQTDKLSTLDIRVQLENRTSIDIEVQVINEHNRVLSIIPAVYVPSSFRRAKTTYFFVHPSD